MSPAVPSRRAHVYERPRPGCGLGTGTGGRPGCARDRGAGSGPGPGGGRGALATGVGRRRSGGSGGAGRAGSGGGAVSIFASGAALTACRLGNFSRPSATGVRHVTHVTRHARPGRLRGCACGALVCRRRATVPGHVRGANYGKRKAQPGPISGPRQCRVGVGAVRVMRPR